MVILLFSMYKINSLPLYTEDSSFLNYIFEFVRITIK